MNDDRLVDDVFLTRVGHDLRGELATMVAGVHYLLRYQTDLSPPAKQMLERVNGAAERLRRLLNEFDNAVWVTHPNPHALVLVPSCSASMLVEGAIETIWPQMTALAVRLEVTMPPGLPEFEADPELIRTALEYVIDFALARSPGKVVGIRGEVRQGAATVVVTDEGGAIDAERLARVLEPFAEHDVLPAGEPGKRRRERLGLGLAIARGILVAHGGSLTVEPRATGVALVCFFPGPSAAVGARPAEK